MLKGLKQFSLPEIEEKVLQFWKEKNIFQKSLDTREKGQHFRFFEGPPTANGKPGIHHILARAFKDIILRYKTMQGYYVGRKAGWDTHGLPVEIEIEKELGIKKKSEIEKFGIAEFNARARQSVWRYKTEWEDLTRRIGFWLDFSDPYITYDNDYIETLWWIFSRIHAQGFLTQLHKSVPWCPRCQTPLSSHELGQPGAYRKVKDPSVYVKFELVNKGKKQKEYFLAWTTTPWTLPSNMALAVNPKFTYTKFKVGEEYIWAYNPPPAASEDVSVSEKISGKKLIGKKYKPLFHTAPTTKKSPHIYEVFGADFVATDEGTGIVHIAPGFGADDLSLWQEAHKEKNVSIICTIDDQGIVTKSLPGGGKFIKDADKHIMDDLERRGILYHRTTVEHEYPFCWRCSSPLIYFARHSWFIEMSKLRSELLSANEKINWVPSHIKEGRFGEWLREVKDWSISRERYWGTPLPIWQCIKCDEHRAIQSLEEFDKKAFQKNEFFLVRHGEAEHNVNRIIAGGPERGKNISKLTKKGKEQIGELSKKLKKQKITLIISSPYMRTKQTARIIAKATGAKVIIDPRIGEIHAGVLNGGSIEEWHSFFETPYEKFSKAPLGGETLVDVKRRAIAFLKDIQKKYSGERIAVISNGDTLWMLEGIMENVANEDMERVQYPKTGEHRKVTFHNWPYNDEGELDLHRPFVDEILLRCDACKGEMQRIEEVADAWFDSGSMPYAQWHYPFENREKIDGQPRRTRTVGVPTSDATAGASGASGFPADYICEGLDQTRGWFYTLLAVSVLLRKGAPYENVITLGLVLDKHGQKMSKSKGNVIDPWEMIEKYGADTIRWHFFTVNDPGEPKRFDEVELGKTLRRFILLLYNSFVYWNTHNARQKKETVKPGANLHTLDQWILSRLYETTKNVRGYLDEYQIGRAGRAIESLGDDLSKWYIRRSRDRLQRGDTQASHTLFTVLFEMSKVIAPFAPFFAEALYQSLKTKEGEYKESVHLEDWPSVPKEKTKGDILKEMKEVRRLASLGQRARAEARLRVRQPLQTLTIHKKNFKLNEDLKTLLKEEVNVKEIKISSKTAEGEVVLDTILTPELKMEGMLREVVRLVQKLRQDAGLKVGEGVEVYIKASKEIEEMLQGEERTFKNAVSATRLTLNASEDKFKGAHAKLESKLNGETIVLGIKK